MVEARIKRCLGRLKPTERLQGSRGGRCGEVKNQQARPLFGVNGEVRSRKYPVLKRGPGEISSSGLIAMQLRPKQFCLAKYRGTKRAVSGYVAKGKVQQSLRTAGAKRGFGYASGLQRVLHPRGGQRHADLRVRQDVPDCSRHAAFPAGSDGTRSQESAGNILVRVEDVPLRRAQLGPGHRAP